MKNVVLLALVFIMCACQIQVPPPATNYVNIMKPGHVLDGSAPVYIIYPSDFVSNGEKEKESSLRAGEKMVAAFQKNKGPVFVSKVNMPLEAGFESASATHAAYLITAIIMKWDDHIPGNFQKEVDEGAIAISIYDVKTKDLLQQSLIGGTGSSVTVNYIPMGTHGPEDCLVDGLASWRSVLYGESQPKT